MRQQSGAPRNETSTPNDFSDLNISELLKKGIKELGYVTPTEFQKGIFDHFTHGKNIVGEGQSNYGKSLAFSLPILSKIAKDMPGPQALIICENFMLSDLAMKECRALGRHVNITVENISTAEKWLPNWPHIVVTSFEDLDKINDLASFGSIHTLFFDALGSDNAMKAISKLGPLLKKGVQVLLFGHDTLNAFKGHAGEIIENAAFVNNNDQPKIELSAEHFVHQAKDDEPKPRALLAALLFHKAKSALIACNEAPEAELLCRYLMRYGFKSVFCSEEQNRHAVGENLNLVASQKIDAFICQSSLLASQNLSNIPFMINFDMIERPQVYEHTTQFNRQAPGLRRVIANLLSNRELGYEAPIKAQCLIDFTEQVLPNGDEVTALATSRIIAMLNEEASRLELGQFEMLARQIFEDKNAIPALALLLRNHFLNQTTKSEPSPAQRERPSYERRRPERRDERPQRPRTNNRNQTFEQDSPAPPSRDEDETPGNVAAPLDGSTRLYVTLGRQDGLDDLASLAQYLSDQSGVDLGHFSGTGMLREHSAHIEVDNDVVDQIINAVHDSLRPETQASPGDHEKGNKIVCERARQSTERKFHRPQQHRRGGNFQRRRYNAPN